MLHYPHVLEEVQGEAEEPKDRLAPTPSPNHDVGAPDEYIIPDRNLLFA